MNETSLVFFLIGGGFFLVGIGFMYSYMKISKLPATTKGVIKGITKSAYAYNVRFIKKLEKEKEAGNTKINTNVRDASLGGDSENYHVIYSYVIDEVEYSRAVDWGCSKGYIEKQIGNEVTVHYDPKYPLESTLSDGTSYKIFAYTFFAIAITFVLLGFSSI